MKGVTNYIFISGIIALLTSCSVTKKVPPGDALYTGAAIKIKGPDSDKKTTKQIRADLASIIRPKPNHRLLGIPFKLLFNNIPLIRKSLGEPPVLLSQVNLENNNKKLQNNLENAGFFHATVTGDTIVTRKKASAVYTIQTGYQYILDSIIFSPDTAILQKTISASATNTFLKTGQPFSLAVIRAERERIDAYLKERGFYYFNPDNIIIQADSTIANNKVNLYVKVKHETPFAARQVYYIGQIFIYPDYSIRQRNPDTLKSIAKFYRGYYVAEKEELYKPALFAQAMQFDQGNVYNITAHKQTLSRLIHLNLFKFVKNRFELVPGIDSPRLNVYYYLTPLPKKSLRAEINASTKSNNLTGSSVTFGFRQRNTFKRGELFTLDATGGFEVQFSGQSKGFNTFRAGLEGNIFFPRFLVPFHLEARGGYVPRTNLLIGYDLLNKQKLYSMQSFRAGFGYNWKERLEIEHQFNLISINYVQPLYITPLYMDSSVNNPTLLKAVEKQFILGTNYNYNYNQLAGKPPTSGGIYFNGNIDLSGNVAGLVTGASTKDGRQKNIFGTPFSQYVRLEADMRYYIKLAPQIIWANRIITGLGIPYGNSSQLPYIKQFFAGGTNSLRAFRSRSVGPGTYQDTVSAKFFPDQSGDIKLEINSELRAKLFGIVHGAVFIDAGNTWLYRDDSLKPGAKFTGAFLKQLAVGAGMGLRFDISFLVIRFDVAIPLRRPYPSGKEWVINQINFSDNNWRKQNIIYNLGIGYPF